MKQIFVLFSVALAIAGVHTTSAQTAASTTSVDWFNDSTTLLKDQFGTALSAGAAGQNNGDLIQLGYYDGATALDPFLGNWVPLTGAGPAVTTIGDSSNGTPDLGPGLFDFSTTTFHWMSSSVDIYDPAFAAAPYTTTSSVAIDGSHPPVGQLLSIRFYNTNTVGLLTLFNAVSESTWTWATPSDAGTVLNAMDLAAGTPIWQDAVHPFETTLPALAIPEPSSLALLGCAGIGLIPIFRRRKV
jgi:hypothetical protein